MKYRGGRVFILIAAMLLWSMLSACAAGQRETKDPGPVITEEEKGTFEGMDYELWKDSGRTEMKLTGGGTYECSWEDTGNCVFRIGRKFDPMRKISELARVRVDYKTEYSPEGDSYLSVYGWMRDPLVEFYIIENWGAQRPGSGQPLAEADYYLGNARIDGEIYDLYYSIRVEKPSIEGIRTFPQLWSVRREPRSGGTITVPGHFRAWESRGAALGKVFEISLAVEGIDSSGEAKILQNDLTIDIVKTAE